MNGQLTTAQEEVLAVIKGRVEIGEPMPTYRELCAHFGWSSTGTARDHLRALARKGFVELSGPHHRRVRLRGVAVTASGVPIVGRVVAGTPVLAEENIEGRLAVPLDWVRQGSYFALKVRGDSMIGAGILDGDFVVVRQQDTAEDGDVVVAILEGEGTLKRLRRSEPLVTLVAENPAYPPIQVQLEAAAVQGVIVGLFRRYGHGTAIRWRSQRIARAEASGRTVRPRKGRS